MRLWKTAEEIYGHWMDNIPEIEGVSALVQELKKNGVPVFLLSNISKGFAERAGEFPMLRVFDKMVFSAVCGMVKPDREIFQHLCETCEIVPEETIFIDDSQKNIDGAKAYGIHGYLFDGNVEKLQGYLQGYLQGLGLLAKA